MTDTRIAFVQGRRVWDSRGRPTVEADILLEGGAVGRGMAPAGASTGTAEALDLRDGGEAFGGYDVRRAVGHVNDEIARALVGLDAADQAAVDARLIALDGTPSKSRLGANALIAFAMSGGARWNAGSSHPAVSQFANKPLGQNTGLVGVFPCGCDNCTSRANPPQPSCPKSPPPPAYEDFQPQPICNVQRDATNSGGDVEVIFHAFLPN